MPVPQNLKSITEHLLHGSKPQNTLPGVSDIPPGKPRRPKSLSKEAKRIHRELCAMLEERAALTRGDSELLRLYCSLHDRQRHAQAKIDVEGEVCIYTRLDSHGEPHDQEKENIWLGVAERAEKQMLTILVQLGLTPAARTRVRPLKAARAPMTAEELYFAKHDNPALLLVPDQEEPE
jgi:P27 family predicted phage terminase small subunit